jgi:hypothetical protein
VTNLDPGIPEFDGGVAFAVSGTQQVGLVNYLGATTDGAHFSALLWNSTASSYVDLYPEGPQAAAYAISGGQQVGFIGRVTGTLPMRVYAALWYGTAASRVDLGSGVARDTSGTQQVGISVNGACLWSSTEASRVDLHPVGAVYSEATAISDAQQAGYVSPTSGYADAHASLWTGTAASWVDLNPAGATASVANDMFGSVQVGFATIGGADHAGLWSGTAASWVDLNPPGATESAAEGIHGNQQVGYAKIGGIDHAVLWNSTASSWVDLNAFLPPGFLSATASGIWSDGVATSIVGTGFTTDGQAALLWTSVVPEPGATSLLGVIWFAAGQRRRRSQ